MTEYEQVHNILLDIAKYSSYVKELDTIVIAISFFVCLLVLKH